MTFVNLEQNNLEISSELQEDVQTTNQSTDRKLKWRKVDIEHIERHFESNFSENNTEKTPLEYFKQFFSDTILYDIVYQTNLYSIQNTPNNPVKTDFAEMSKFIGINLLASVVHMPQYRMYWTQSTRFPPIADVMPRNRFEILKKNFHLNDNNEMKERSDPQYDRLFKIRPYLTAVRENFLKVEPEEMNSIDEVLIPTKCKNSLKQYISSKPHKWGIKMFARNGASGIMYDFEVYTGKSTITNKTELGISGDVVLKLCKSLPKNENFKIFTDNWFTSYKLISALKENGMFLTGTVRHNRLPKCEFVSDKSLKCQGRGSYDFRTERRENICAVKWLDNKPIYFASSIYGIDPVQNVLRWSSKDKKHVDVSRPNIVTQYVRYMGGVDLSDMLVALYRSKIGTKKYYLRIFYHLLDVCVVNAWLLYKRHCTQEKVPAKKSLLEFKAEIADGMINAGFITNERKRGRPSDQISDSPAPKRKRIACKRPIPDVQYDGVGHMPLPIEKKERCKYCNNRVSFSRIKCKKCNVALCLTTKKNCFDMFHNK